MSGIANQRDSLEAPSLERIAVDQRKLENLQRLVDEFGHVEPGEPPCPKCRYGSVVAGKRFELIVKDDTSSFEVGKRLVQEAITHTGLFGSGHRPGAASANE